MPDSKELSERLGVRDATYQARPGNPIRRSLERFRARVQSRARHTVGDWGLRSVANVARRMPIARPDRHHVQVIRDLRYRDTGNPDHVLDIYRPTVRKGPYPVILYVHGGGFSQLSKDTHWIMGLVFARYGYLVANISYRLAPQNPFPAAIEDSCHAYRWVVDNIARYGGDLSRLALAGESAGGNLVSSLTIAACYERPEPYARRVFETAVTPVVTIPACGLLQVSDPGRFHRRRSMPRWVDGIIRECSRLYLRGVDINEPGAIDLADPLPFFESGRPPDRDLPAFFIPVGTRDPLLDDTRRLAHALEHMDVPVEARYYKGEIHAFHAMVWRRPARRCWRDMFGFLHRYLAPEGVRAELPAAPGEEAKKASPPG
jgi:acetyl esterase